MVKGYRKLVLYDIFMWTFQGSWLWKNEVIKIDNSCEEITDQGLKNLRESLQGQSSLQNISIVPKWMNKRFYIFQKWENYVIFFINIKQQLIINLYIWKNTFWWETFIRTLHFKLLLGFFKKFFWVSLRDQV